MFNSESFDYKDDGLWMTPMGDQFYCLTHLVVDGWASLAHLRGGGVVAEAKECLAVCDALQMENNQ